MSMQILYTGAMFFAGWLWFYLFARQILFNLVTAYPLIRKMQKLDPALIAVGAKRYTTTSVIVCSLIAAILVFVVVRFCPMYLIIAFFVGMLICLIMLIRQLSPENHTMFDSFCSAYCRFVPDDELRSGMYDKNVKKINKRLREMGFDHSFVPEFRE